MRIRNLATCNLKLNQLAALPHLKPREGRGVYFVLMLAPCAKACPADTQVGWLVGWLVGKRREGKMAERGEEQNDAARYGDIDRVRSLLLTGVDPNWRNDSQVTPPPWQGTSHTITVSLSPSDLVYYYYYILGWTDTPPQG